MRDRDDGDDRRGRRDPDFGDDRRRRGEVLVSRDDRPGPDARPQRRQRKEPDFSPPLSADDWDHERPARGRRTITIETGPEEPRMSRRREPREDWDDRDDEAEPPRRTARTRDDREPPRRSRDRAPRRARSLFGRLVYWGAVAGVWCVIGLAGFIGYHAMKLPPIDQLAVPKRPPNVAILAADGTLLANRGETGGRNIAISELPAYVPKAFVAIEDKRFYSHFGLDVLGLGRAVMRNLTSRKVEQGGSTLTQQLAKNLFLTQERTMSRKAQEVILALWLERTYKKDQILELYLNRVYFGSGAYGIEAAAQRYYGKPARSLNIAEATTLAGLMKSPSRLAPNRNPTGAAERAAVVLREMQDQGYVTEKQVKQVAATPATVRKTGGAGSVNYAADWVMDLIDDFVGPIDGDVTVTTTLVTGMQNAAEQALTAILDKNGDAKNVDQGALVAMSPDGAVRALVGGRNYAESQFNRAVLAKRQPGSAFKPFVYLAAMESGLTPETVREDSAVNIKGWQPENYTREYFGNVTLTRALAMSLNTVAVKLGQEVGIRTVARTAQRLGINSPLSSNASLALGTSEVSPLEMATAYTTFANGGLSVTPYIIARVRTASGQVLYERKAPARSRLIEQTPLAQLNLMMRETLVSGTARKAEIPGWVAAGKTGTTQEYKDAWFVGYTGALTAAVWLGNDDGDPMKKVSGSGLPVEIWTRFMRAALQGTAPVALPTLAHLSPSASLPPDALPPAPPAIDLNERSSEDMRPPMPITPPPQVRVVPRAPVEAPPVAEAKARPQAPVRIAPLPPPVSAPRPAAQDRLVPPRNVGPVAAHGETAERRVFVGPAPTDRARLDQLLQR